MLTDKNPVFALPTYKLVFIKKECMDLMDRILCKTLKPTLVSSYFASEEPGLLHTFLKWTRAKVLQTF